MFSEGYDTVHSCLVPNLQGRHGQQVCFTMICVFVLCNRKSFEEEKLKIVVFLMIYKVLTML